MTRGRPKKTNQQKKLQGTHRPWRDFEHLDIEPLTELPEPPSELGKVGYDEWRRMGDLLIKKNLLTSFDLTSLFYYAKEWETYIEARGKDKVQSSPNSGYLTISPWHTIAKNSLDAAMKIAAKFGLTPSDRAKIPAGETKKSDPLNDFLKQSNG